MTSELTRFATRLREFMAERDGHPVTVRANAVAAAKFQSFLPVEGPVSDEPPHSEETFNRFALELFALQFAANPVYRKLCDARRATPRSVTHCSQIPATPTAAFKEFDMTCLSPAQRTHVFHSSGTTKQRPSRHFHCAASLDVYEASLLPSFRAHVMPELRLTSPDLRLTILTPPPDLVSHSSLVHMFETVRRALGASDAVYVGRVTSDGAWGLDFPDTLRALCEACESTTPLVLLGTAFSFIHLVDFLAEQNLRLQLPAGSRVMETGGYKGRSRSLPQAKLHSLIIQRLGIPLSHIICEYGMSELSSQAYHHALDGIRNKQQVTRTFHFPPWARTQIISPETNREVAVGETGLIRVLDLANVFSVMAVQTEDLAIRRADGFELLGRAAPAEPRGCSLMAVNS